MNDLDTLRPEVQKALDDLSYFLTGTHNHDDFYTIRAELRRLAEYEQAAGRLAVEKAEFRQRAEKAEAELRRLADENARLNKIESLATEQRLQMEDVELYLMDVSQPDDEDAPWCDCMKSAIELLVQDCNYAVGQKNKAEAELAALKARIANSRTTDVFESEGHAGMVAMGGLPCEWIGKNVRMLVED